MLRPTFTGLAWALTLCLLGCGGSSGTDGTPGPALTPNSIDFFVEPQATVSSMQFLDRLFTAEECAVEEGAVPASGLRRILRFDTMVVNMGALPCVVGDPANPAPPLTSADLEYHDCHGHYHLHGYATYELKTSDGTLVGIGQKQSFCILDSVRVVQGHSSMGFTCSYQGLSPGWADIYPRGVTGQWVDVSGVPEGDYFLWLTVNPEGLIVEVDDQQPNVAIIPVHVPSPSAAVANLDDHGDVALEGTGMPYPAGFQATIQTAGDLDFFLIKVVSGNAYTLRTELLSLTDSKIRVFTSDGVALLYENDDVTPVTDLSSRIDFTATLTGTLAVEVSGPSSATGMYRIIVE